VLDITPPGTAGTADATATSFVAVGLGGGHWVVAESGDEGVRVSTSGDGRWQRTGAVDGSGGLLRLGFGAGPGR